MKGLWSSIPGGILAFAFLAVINGRMVGEVTEPAVARASTHGPAQGLPDALIRGRLRVSLLRNIRSGDGLRISVRAVGGAVLLSGEVADPASINAAGDAARAAPAVAVVRNALRHDPGLPAPVGDGAAFRDALLVAEVELALLEELGGTALGLTVSATDGAVRLSGPLAMEADRARALAEVRAVPAVRRVEDHLHLASP